MLNDDDQVIIVMRIDAKGILFEEINLHPFCSHDFYKKAGGYDILHYHLFHVSSSGGFRKTTPRNTSYNGVGFVM